MVGGVGAAAEDGLGRSRRGAPAVTGRFRVLGRAMASWRTASVVLLSFSSGLPLGLVTIAIPDWMRSLHLDIRIVVVTKALPGRIGRLSLGRPPVVP